MAAFFGFAEFGIGIHCDRLGALDGGAAFVTRH